MERFERARTRPEAKPANKRRREFGRRMSVVSSWGYVRGGRRARRSPRSCLRCSAASLSGASASAITTTAGDWRASLRTWPFTPASVGTYARRPLMIFGSRGNRVARFTGSAAEWLYRASPRHDQPTRRPENRVRLLPTPGIDTQNVFLCRCRGPCMPRSRTSVSADTKRRWWYPARPGLRGAARGRGRTDRVSRMPGTATPHSLAARHPAFLALNAADIASSRLHNLSGERPARSMRISVPPSALRRLACAASGVYGS
jgi:hypothetical protein